MRGKALKFAIIMGVVGAIGIALGAKTLGDTSTAPPPPKPDVGRGRAAWEVAESARAGPPG